MLGFLGGAAGIMLAYAGVRALRSFMPANLPMGNEARVDAVVLGFGLLLSAVASCAFGLAPALFAAKANVNESLRDGDGRSGESGGRRRARSFLAAAEVALAMVLLVMAGLLLRSFSKLMAVSPGFEVQNMVKAEVSLPRTQYATPEKWSAFSNELLSRIQAEPGIKNAAVAVPLPLADGFVNLGFDIEGTPPKTAAESRTANYVAVSPEYFRVMGIPLLAGRFIDAHDVLSTARVTVISKAMARVYFANQDPIGKRLIFGFPPDGEEAREIVGVVGDVRDVALELEPRAMMYAPFAQAPFPGAVLIVKSSLGASSVAAAIRQDVQAMDKDLPVTDIAQMADVMRTSVAQPKFRTRLLGLFAAMALVLAATGIFGVISYSVSRRTREIGVRVALGASRGEILRMILRETLVLAGTGLAVGIPCALGASRLMGHMLFGVSAGDPVTLVAVGCTLAGVALLAAYWPARRAMRVDPTVALRYE
jgi:putative ABC transport system permease protein